MLKLCNICGERPRSKNQGTCSPCRWAKHKAKENERRKTPERRQQVNQWKRTRTISAEAKQTDIGCRKRRQGQVARNMKIFVDKERGYSFSQIAKELGFTRERARQIYERELRRRKWETAFERWEAADARKVK